MSKRNSQQNKQAARERLRAERERQAKKDKMRRQLTVGGALVAILAIAGGIGVAVANMGGDSDEEKAWKAAADKKLVKPANTTGKKGTAIVIGDEKAKETLDMYEDPRCPACAVFEEKGAGDALLKDVEDGRYKVRYVLVNFLDGMAGGTGSKNAVSALGAALNVSPEAFIDYKKALFSEKNHPDESDDVFAKDKNLLDIADQVPALKDNKEFRDAVDKGTYDRWALEIGKLFGKKGVNSTPTLLHNGEKLTYDGKNTPLEAEQFQAAIDEEFGKK